MTQPEIAARVERFKAALHGAGVRVTPQRVEIFREVLSSRDHPDVESIFKSVKRRLPQVSLDTVYRTLWTATDLGLLATLGPREAKLRFDANPAPHHHFVCTRCGAIQDFEAHELDAMPLPERVAALGSVQSTRVEVRGLCARCSPR